MTLLELLVKELPKRGGWPEGIKSVAQSSIDGELYFYDRPYDSRGCEMKSVYTLEINDEKGVHLASVTCTQYEAALAASKAEWNGEWLPPVGCECEALYDTGRDEWFLAKIIANDNGSIVGRWLEGPGVYSIIDYPSPCGSFRPIRSEADKKRDAAIERMVKVIGITPESAAICYEISLAGGV